jgi:hypothetical protein
MGPFGLLRDVHGMDRLVDLWRDLGEPKPVIEAGR